MSLTSFFTSGDLYHPSTWDNYDPIGQIKEWGGDIYDKVTGNPDDIKGAYDAAIAASKQNATEIRNFLMQGKGQAQQYYAPMQHMFQGAYGTEGIQGPQIPQASQSPFSQMYGKGR